MRTGLGKVGILLAVLLFPHWVRAQDSGLAGDIGGLQTTLNTVYNTMIVHCAELIGIGRAIAGFATIWYIGYRVWGHLARAEAIDFYPLLRPFAIGIAIGLFPGVIAMMNGVLQPTVAGTAALVNDSNQALSTLLQQKEDALKQSNDWQMYVGPDGSGSLEKWEQLSGEADDGFLSGVSNRVKFEIAKWSYNFKNSIKLWLSEILQVLFEAAALCINTVRTFYLIILAILGPLVFGLSVFDGLHHILRSWLVRYVSIFLWLPIANIFGSLIGQVQQEMVKLDIAQIQATGNTTFSPTDTAYLIFLLMAIVGYFTVPSIANQIIHTGHHEAHLRRLTNMTIGTAGNTSPWR
ncbi:MAG: conjugative transposon protein TraJ [Bacteroidota bacterium]|nr:conjugative transposon protein TraJ [Bacteroidota bacterium]MDP4247377.1 conjugative transposon protein TraJ [Bacteroidota bacterium]MDP4260040.1 conjugative transposon protein TraJ [Bacteroidota bacterium]